jgi:hypothetical protein
MGTHWDEKDCGGDDECPDIEREPSCSAAKHEWTSEGEGGAKENPGVWSLGGTVLKYSERCEHCGVRRITVEYGSQRNPHQCDTVRFEEPAHDPTTTTTRSVVTHQYTDGHRVTVCEAHEADVPDFSPAGASYSGVSHGAHRGECDRCAAEIEAP